MVAELVGLLLNNMVWQDFIFGLGSIVFIIALIPTLIGKNKPAWETSMLTSMVLTTFAGTYATLELWFAASTTLITGIMWLIILIQTTTQKDWYANGKSTTQDT